MIQILLPLLVCATPTSNHDGPDPIGSWRLEPAQVDGTTLRPVLGARGRIEGEQRWIEDAAGKSMDYDGRTTRIVLSDDIAVSKPKLPEKHMTVSAWVSVTAPQRWGGILGVLQDSS